MDFAAELLADLDIAQTVEITAAYEGTGFIPGSRGSFMLDFVFVAMFGIILLMAYSIYLVKFQQKYELHKKLQVVLGVVLLVAVLAFEIDMRFFTDWELLAAPSQYYGGGEKWGPVWISLVIHLIFAIPTTFLWMYVIVQALRKFPSPVKPNAYSPTHLRWAKFAAFEMFMTALTGWVFYVLAFVL